MYMCEECNYVWDVQRSIGDPEVRQCPKCLSYEIEETRPSNVPQGQANGRERSAYVQLADVRAIVKKMFKVDTDDFGMTEARRLQKAEIEGFNKGIDAVLKKLSEHFG